MFGKLYFSHGHPNTHLKHSTWQSVTDPSILKPWSIFDDKTRQKFLEIYKVRNCNKKSCIRFLIILLIY